MITHVTNSEAETFDRGRALGQVLEAGDVVALDGPLGAGKTAFVRGLASGLGCNPEDVSSPTFAIVQEYRGRLTLQHVDLYRLNAAEAEDLALDDLLEGAVMAIEWPGRWARVPDGAVRVTIEVSGETSRRITVAGPIRPGSSALPW